MECAIRAETIKDWLSGNLSSTALAPSSSTLCSTMCRRAASFPVVNGHHPAASLLKVRSQSESDGLNRLGLSASRSIIEQLQKLQNVAVSAQDKQPENADSSQNVDSDESSHDNSVDSAGDRSSPGKQVDSGKVKTPAKSVRFADDCGKELATVRVMTEPSDYPPTISSSVIRRLLGKTEEDDEEKQISASWEISFKQPASEYVKFRETLDRGYVALENVLLKNEICRMVGTVKVKNITFEKKVFVRFTSDGWKSFLDCVAAYQPSSSKFYDTFSFEIELPNNGNDPKARIEFCICFEATSPGSDTPQQFWDSNGGRNYVLTSQGMTEESRQVPTLFGKQDLYDAYTSDYENWTRFAAWRNLSTEGPYW